MPAELWHAVEPGIRVVHADAAIIVLDKPSGLLSVPGRGPDKQDCLSARVQAAFADALVVHRLDMSTSGLIVMARGAMVQRALSEAFANRTVTKRYEAIVQGEALAPRLRGESPLTPALDEPCLHQVGLNSVLDRAGRGRVGAYALRTMAAATHRGQRRARRRVACRGRGALHRGL